MTHLSIAFLLIKSSGVFCMSRFLVLILYHWHYSQRSPPRVSSGGDGGSYRCCIGNNDGAEASCTDSLGVFLQLSLRGQVGGVV